LWSSGCAFFRPTGDQFFTLLSGIAERLISAVTLASSQVVALAYYLFATVPGGTQGLKFLMGLFGQAASSCFGAVTRTLAS
jgi:hypothetical protein